MNFDTFLFAGHGKSELTEAYDSGAVSFGKRENDIANMIIDNALSHLKYLGLNIHRDENNYIDEDLRGNNYRFKCGLIIHINAGRGTGCEIYVPAKEKYLTNDFELVKNIGSIMGTNRGVKSRISGGETLLRKNGTSLNATDYYKEIRNAWSLGISASLVEIGFIDTKKDLDNMLNNINQIGYYVAKYMANICNKELASSPSVNSNNIYVVQKGDTLYGIARKLNRSIDQLVKLNNIQNKNLIQIGQKIKY